MAESEEEWNEAKKVNNRLIELGVTPVVEIEQYPVIIDVREMLEYDCKVVDKTMTVMKKDGSIVSPVRCKWEPAEK